MIWFYNEDFFQNALKEFIRFHKYLWVLDEEYLLYLESLFEPFNLSLKQVDNLYKNNRKKFSRALKRVKMILKYYQYCYFVTLTFDNMHIDKFKYYFNNFKKYKLSEFCYIGNIDYGSINERVHYHVLIGSSVVLTKDILGWKCGFFDLKLCNSNSKALTNYILKLTYHSFKNSPKLIYSRLNKKINKKID